MEILILSSNILGIAEGQMLKKRDSKNNYSMFLILNIYGVRLTSVII